MVLSLYMGSVPFHASYISFSLTSWLISLLLRAFLDKLSLGSIFNCLMYILITEQKQSSQIWILQQRLPLSLSQYVRSHTESCDRSILGVCLSDGGITSRVLLEHSAACWVWALLAMLSSAVRIHPGTCTPGQLLGENGSAGSLLTPLRAFTGPIAVWWFIGSTPAPGMLKQEMVLTPVHDKM